jgi:hypothetical protein
LKLAGAVTCWQSCRSLCKRDLRAFGVLAELFEALGRGVWTQAELYEPL